jgi:hypothetical protein
MAKKSLKNIFMKFVSVVDKGDNPEAEVVLFKSDNDNDNNKGGVVMKTIEEILKGMPEEDAKIVQVELDKIPVLEKDKNDLSDKVSELEKSKPIEPVEEPSDEDTLIKSADPKIQEILKKAQEEAKLNKEKAEQFEKEKKEEQEKLRKEEIKKEVSKYNNIGATEEDLVEIFSKMDQDKELLEKVIGILGSCNKALEGSALMKAVGSDGDPIVKTAVEEVEDKATELIKSDPKLTIEQARVQIYKQYPDLQAKILKE